MMTLFSRWFFLIAEARECRHIRSWAMSQIAAFLTEGFKEANKLEACPVPKNFECLAHNPMCTAMLDSSAVTRAEKLEEKEHPGESGTFVRHHTCNCEFLMEKFSAKAIAIFMERMKDFQCSKEQDLYCVKDPLGIYTCRTVTRFMPMKVYAYGGEWLPIWVVAGLVIVSVVCIVIFTKEDTIVKYKTKLPEGEKAEFVIAPRGSYRGVGTRGVGSETLQSAPTRAELRESRWEKLKTAEGTFAGYGDWRVSSELDPDDLRTMRLNARMKNIGAGKQFLQAAQDLREDRTGYR